VEAKFTVNLLSEVPEQVRTTVALQLAEKFNVSIAKMNRLLRNNQGPITRPISERDANKIAKVLGRAGIEVAVVRSDLNAVLLVEEPIVSSEDKLELREMLAGSFEAELPQAERLGDSALEVRPSIVSSLKAAKKTPVPLSVTPSKFLSRPVMIALVSLLFTILTVTFGVSLMMPDRPLLPSQAEEADVPSETEASGETEPSGQLQLTAFEQGMAASTLGDYSKALELWRVSADEGDRQAQFELAWLYMNGLGTAKNVEKAAEYFGKAAEQGQIEAQHKLGQLYLEGQGVPQDDAEAAKWLKAAALQGYGESQLLLGQLYLGSEGFEINLLEADTWLTMAAKQGVAGATKALDELQTLQESKTPATDPQSNADMQSSTNGQGSTSSQSSAETQIATDIFMAVEKGDPQEVIRAVLAGADVNVRSQDGYTALMYAVTKGNPDVVREIISGGAEIDMQSSTGWTALMFAAKDQPALIELLVNAGADKTLKNNTGQTAYDVAVMFQPSSAPLLIQE
jgi:TPR repeat protein